MLSVEEIVEEAKQLTPEQREQLIVRLQRSSLPPKPAITEEQRQEAIRKFRARAGQMHSDYTDVSSDKYKHVAASILGEK